ncbi:MAG TPA: hypothetical protein VF541_21090, partial [Longimicrobium sp.]
MSTSRTKQRRAVRDRLRIPRTRAEGAAAPVQAGAAVQARRALPWWLAWAAGWIGVMAVVAPRVSHVFIPRGRAFTSDHAIPVLMMRARDWSVFDIYYWGQDRLGAWHLLLLRAVGQLTGHPIGWAQFHLCATVWVLGAVAVLACFAGLWRWAAAGMLAAVLVGNPDSRIVMFDAAHPYAWQLTALLLAWWGLRRLAENGDAPAPGRGRLRAATAFAAFLAHWSSPLSGPLLLFVSGVEALRARALDAASARSVMRRWREGALVVGVAMAGELVLRLAYYSPWLRQQPYYATRTGLDWDGLGANALKVLGMLRASASLPLLIAGTMGAFAAAVLLWRARRGGRPQGEHWRLDGAALVLGCWVVAAAELPVLALLSHVRINLFHPRYFALVYLFGSLAGLLTLVGVAAILPLLSRRQRAVLALAGAAGVAAGVLRMPEPRHRRDVPAELAGRLERLAPGAPLVGGFWGTYVFSGLQHPQTMLKPVPCEGQTVYARWWIEALRRQPRAVVAQMDVCEGFGAPGKPEQWIHQYGTL